MFNLIYLETKQLPSKVQEAYSMAISETGHIAIPTASLVFLYEMTPSLENTTKLLQLKKSVLYPRQYAMSMKLGIHIASIIDELPREYLFEAVLSAELSPHIPDCTPFVMKTKKCAWSPAGIDRNKDCVLATLSNNGVVEVYVKVYDVSFTGNYLSMCNLTETYINIHFPNWPDTNPMTPLQKYQELIARTNEIKVKAIAWSNKIAGEFCILILAHTNGKISFWKVQSGDELLELSVVLMNVYQTEHVYITALTWKQCFETALLFVGDKSGSASVFNVSVSSKEVLVKTGCILWPTCDEKKVTDIHIITAGHGHFILLEKHTTLIIVSLRDNNSLLEPYEFSLGNETIKGIEIIDNRAIVVTNSGIVREISLNYTSQSVDVKWRYIYLDLNLYLKVPWCMVSSRNKVFFAFLTHACKAKDTKIYRNDYELTIFVNTEVDIVETLVKNQSRSLTYYWDCLEILRYRTILESYISFDSLPSETPLSSLDIYTLKVSQWVAKLCELIAEKPSKPLAKIQPFEDISVILHLKIMLYRIDYLWQLYQKNIKLSTFQTQNALLLLKYLRQIPTIDWFQNLDQILLDQILDTYNRLKAFEAIDCVAEPCDICDEAFTDVSCIPPHFDTRCAISLMQIKGFPKYKCLSCNSVAHDEIEKEVKLIVCPVCDIPMKKRTDNKFLRNEVLNLQTTKNVMASSDGCREVQHMGDNGAECLEGSLKTD